MSRKVSARGKVLLTGEYAVLDGGMGLALPTHFSQSMEVKYLKKGEMTKWSSRELGKEWFSATFDNNLEILETTDWDTAFTLRTLISTARIAVGSHQFLRGASVVTDTDFPLTWGLGSSSTLVALIAIFSGTNPYLLLASTIGGSGYDVACAMASGPILYRKELPAHPEIKPVNLNREITSKLYFIYSGKKQSTRAEVDRYQNLLPKTKIEAVQRVSEISRRIPEVYDFQEFCTLIHEHNHIVAGLLQREMPLKEFSDFPGVLKPLGAWGGDFFLAASAEPYDVVKEYFNDRGYSIAFSYPELIYEKPRSKFQRTYNLYL
ncbi:MAG: GYDIA family GHMP kinase [Flavobacteriales bacterium]|nr:GYDIA family GHMP kinase [Flavobacteriales bacterium]MCX7769129.1 GYDIA family GHMP kinase [Flavobacteriales bacterium]MDW8410169.1 GYDIA family GHMP kinase [Flavobacteriales bacterium]